jgi:putative DNA primase/helicase
MSQIRAPTATFSEEQLRAFLGFIMDPSVGCIESRSFKADFDRGRMIVKGERYSKTISGWYDDPRALVIDAKCLRGVSGYVTVNPVQADLLARSYNRATVVKHATLDIQIVCLRWLYIDIDPIRPPDISSTDTELALAIACRDQILGDHPELRESAIWGCSGNGAWILVRLPDYTPDEEHVDLVLQALKSIAARYATDKIEIDPKTRNPSRVMCLPGTLKCKGSDHPDRPWRLVTFDSWAAGITKEIPQPIDLKAWLEKNPAPAPEPQVSGSTSFSMPASWGGASGLSRSSTQFADRSRLIYRAACYLNTFDPAIWGQGGSDQTFDAACSLVKGFDLSVSEARPILQAWSLCCIPPWSDWELDHKLTDADKKGDDKPRGYLVDTPLSRHHSHATRPHASASTNGERSAPSANGSGSGSSHRENHDSSSPSEAFGSEPELPPIDVNALIGQVQKYIETGRLDEAWKDINFLGTLARLEIEDVNEFESIKFQLKRIKGFSEKAFNNVMQLPRKVAGDARQKDKDSGSDGDTTECSPGMEDNPHRLARLFVSQHVHPDGLTIRFWRDEYHLWDGAAYRILPDKEIRAQLNSFVAAEFERLHTLKLIKAAQKEGKGEPKAIPKPIAVTTRLVGDVIQALSGLTVLTTSTYPEQPCWLDGRSDWPVHEVLPARNGLIHLPSVVAGKPCTILPTPAFFGAYALDYNFDANAPEPTEWLRFLNQLWEDDQESIESLQEWFGYLLSLDTRQQKILMMIGPKRSGRGTIARVIKALAGSNNVVNPTLSSFATNFGLAPMIGKPIAIIGDARLSGRPDNAAIVERLVAISGEDDQTIDRKHLPAWTGKLPTRFVLISNELPKLRDASGALPGRMIVLRLTKTFYGLEDKDLSRRLKEELPGILLWAIKGWARLYERQEFLQPKTAADLVKILESLSSPILAFVKECLVVHPDAWIRIPDLFNNWRTWCQSRGQEHTGDEHSFGRDLHAAIPGLRTKRPRIGTERVRVYVGVRMKEAQEIIVDEGEEYDVGGSGDMGERTSEPSY